MATRTERGEAGFDMVANLGMIPPVRTVGLEPGEALMKTNTIVAASMAAIIAAIGTAQYGIVPGIIGGVTAGLVIAVFGMVFGKKKPPAG